MESHHDDLVGTQPPVNCYRASALPDRASYILVKKASAKPL